MNSTGQIASVVMAGREASRGEQLVNRADRNIQHGSAMIDRLQILRDKIAGGQPTPTSDKPNPPRVMPNGLLAILEEKDQVMLDQLSMLDSLLSDLERHF